MKVLLLVVVLVYVSQHALTVQVEVYEGANSVLLPCRVSFMLEDTTVMWNRYDLRPTTVHRWYEDRDELDTQNQRYRGRTAMASDGSEPEDLSLTLTKPQVSDSGNYTCDISKQMETLTLMNVELKVKVSKVEVKVEEGSEFVHLPCQFPPPLPKDTTVEWTRSDMIVHIYPNSSDQRKQQDELFCSRTLMKPDLLKSGDVGVTLKFPTERDGGEYVCTVHRDGDVLRQRVELHHVRERFSTWATVLLVLLALGLVAGGGSAVFFWQYFTNLPKVKATAGAESVQLPFKLSSNLPQDVTVEWRRFGLRTTLVHEYPKQNDQSGKQNQAYHDRTEMPEDAAESGDLSLTLKQLKPQDSGFYTCTVSGEHVQRKTLVRLQVRVPDVVAEEGDGSVVLRWKTKGQPPPDASVEWSRSEPFVMLVHVHQNGSGHPVEQDWFYRNRTEMTMQNKDLRLTLKEPTLFDAGTYCCTVSRNKRVLETRNITLQVKEPNQTQDDKSHPVDVKSSTPLMSDPSDATSNV